MKKKHPQFIINPYAKPKPTIRQVESDLESKTAELKRLETVVVRIITATMVVSFIGLITTSVVGGTWTLIFLLFLVYSVSMLIVVFFAR